MARMGGSTRGGLCLLGASLLLVLVAGAPHHPTQYSETDRQLLAELPHQRGHANLRQLYESVSAWQDERALPHAARAMYTASLADVQSLWFDQRLSHFDVFERRTFRQRYYINDASYTPGGPVLIYLGGEARLEARNVARGELVSLAQANSALIIGIEHRFYGLSHPFTNLSTPNLQYLSSQEALADAVWLLTNLTNTLKLTGPKIVVGGSYPGALSAWFRLKFPHLVVGSLASSAPVRAKEDFFEYDEGVQQAAGPDCTNAARAVMRDLEALGQAAIDQLNCTGLSQLDFLYTLADAVSYAAQYSSSSPGPLVNLLPRMCSIFADASLTAVQRFSQYFAILLPGLATTCQEFTTNTAVLSDITVNVDAAARQWYYQSCTEFGYFQTAPAVNPLRSPRIDLTYHRQLCATVFAQPLIPHINFTNTYYGGDQPSGSNIYFVNGGIDPWRLLSVTSPIATSPYFITRVVDGASHCADLRQATAADSPQLNDARTDIAAYVAAWFKGTQPGPAPPVPEPRDANRVAYIIAIVVTVVSGLAFILLIIYRRRINNNQQQSATYVPVGDQRRAGPQLQM